MMYNHRGLCLLRNELRRRCRIYPGGTVAGDAYRRDLAVTYMSRISHLLASVVLDDASAALDGMDAVLGEVRRSEFLGLTDDGTDAADQLAEEVEAARNEVQYLIDDGMGDEGCEALVLSAMEDRILPQAEEALTRFREEVAPNPPRPVSARRGFLGRGARSAEENETMSKRLKDSWSKFAAEADRACGLRGDPLLSVSELVALAERRGLTVLRRGRPTTSAEIRALSNRLPVRPIGPLEISQGPRRPRPQAMMITTTTDTAPRVGMFLVLDAASAADRAEFVDLHWKWIKAMVDWRGSAALDIAIDDAIEAAPEGVRVALRVPVDGPHGPEWTQAVTSGDDYTEGRADRETGSRPLAPTSPARAARYWGGYLGAVPLR